jgi:hypothetical protein
VTSGPGGRLSLVMALPSIWRTSAKAADTTMLATAVFMHEFTHTQTSHIAGIDGLIARGLPDDVNDDVVQTRFAGRDGFADAYMRERDLFFAAAVARDDREARRLAADAFQLLETRRGTFFTGADAVYADAEDLFLTLEGAGQFAVYQWLVDRRGGGLSAAEALAVTRRDGRQWSQDQGLALFLVLDRLADDAVPRLLGSPERTVLKSMRQLLGSVR